MGAPPANDRYDRGLDDGIVLDLSRLDSIEVDVEGRSAWAGGGATAGDYTQTVGRYGLATGFGDTPSVGIGGITLAGGMGFLHRAYGLTIDSLLAAEVVTADGRILAVDDRHHPELFWALRGGGGNFGVVTRFRYRLHEVSDIVGGMLILPGTPRVLHALVEQTLAAPDGLSGMFNLAIAPPLPFIPTEVHGTPIIMAALVHSGDLDEGERVFAGIRALARPVLDGIERIRYPQLYESEAGPPHPVHIAMEPMLLDRFDRAQAEAMLDALRRSSAPMSAIQFRPLGGAVRRVPLDATAFPHRQRNLAVSVAAMFMRSEDRSEHQAWANATADELRRPDTTAYVGFLTDDSASRVQSAYGSDFWSRLLEVKRRYDPENLFRRNHNVAPD